MIISVLHYIRENYKQMFYDNTICKTYYFLLTSLFHVPKSIISLISEDKSLTFKKFKV